jgi:serine/threonine protein kinase/Tol biopolymer transport system component/ABC-type branched-subunit amino acid transport system substrate-binding protein
MIGETINDRYRVLEQISADHLATSYLARDQTLNEMVVLKVIHPELVAGSQLLDRFLSEADKLQKLTAPQALKALDCAQLAEGPYVVFQYTGGKTLADLCQAAGALSLERALDIANQLGMCLVDAHAHNLVHRDLRPANILLDGDGQVRVTDFGLAWGLDLGQLMADGRLEASVYHAPELAAGAETDARADLYSLGALLFQMLTGQPPSTEDEEPRPSRHVPDLPPEIDDLVIGCLAEDQEDRPQNAAEFLEGIDQVLRDVSTAPGAGPMGMEEALVGHTLGPYRLVEKLGRGGMATVYKGYEASLDRYVAIKVLPQHFAQDSTFLTRFRREAKAIARLNHPNIVPVFNFGKQRDLTYIAMQYVEGGTLKDSLGQPMPSQRAVKLVLQIARALSYAHKRDVVHRDVKPANVLIAESDWPLLSDFGLARMMGSSVQLTQTGVGVGTPSYMSPEQGQGLKVDGRSDIYSLGIMLYEMLTGAVPFQADTPLAVVLKHITAPLPMPREINPDIPEPVERIILKATAKDPAHRFQTAEELIDALERVLAGLPVEAPPIPVEAGEATAVVPPGLPTTTTPAAGAEISAATEVLAPPKAKPRVPIWALGLAGVLVLGVLIVAVAVLGLLARRGDRAARVEEASISPTFREEAQERAPDVGSSPAAIATKPPAPTPTPPAGPPLAKREVKPCNWDGLGPGLCIYPLEGGRPIKILEDTNLDFSAPVTWSPDGQQLAFSALEPGGSQDRDNKLYVVNADGSGLTQLPSLSNDIGPAWSPDGEWLAFHSGCDLAIIHPDGSEPTLIWRHAEGKCVDHPQWSPDGQKIAVSVILTDGMRAFPITREIWVFSRDSASTTRPVSITHENENCTQFEVAFNPDGRQVAYTDEKCESWLVSADGSGQAKRLDEFPYLWTASFHPQWVTEGKMPLATPEPKPDLPAEQVGKIVETCDEAEPPQICMRDVQTEQATQLTHDLDFENIGFSTWSPDGEQIIFDAGSDSERTRRNDHKLYLIRADGSNLTQVSHGDSNDIMPAWSPDGDWIAFHRNCELWLIRPDGSEEKRLIEWAETFCASAMTWSPDSQQIAFVNMHEAGAAPREVWVVNRDGSDAHAVYTYEGPLDWAFPAWSPDGRRLAVWYHKGDIQEGFLINADGSGGARKIKTMPWSWLHVFWPQWGGQPLSAAPDPWGQVVVPAGEPIRLAFVGAFSDDMAPLGEVQLNGMLIALEDVATLHGFPIDVAISADGGCTDPDVARGAAEQVVSDRGMVGVIGHSCSASCRPGMEVYEAAHLVMISPSCSSPNLSEPGHQVFNRVILRDDQGGEAYHDQVRDGIGYRNLARRYEERYGQPLEEIEFGIFATYAYDATMILVEAIKQVAVVDEAGNLVIDRQALARAVRATTDYRGTTGTISFDDNGDRLP